MSLEWTFWQVKILQAKKASAHVNERRQAHEAQKQNPAGSAAATPGADPHINVPWTDEIAMVAFNQLNTDRRARQISAIALSDNLSALIFVSLAD